MCQGICIAAFTTFKSASFFRISTFDYHRPHLVPFKKKKRVESSEKSTSKKRIYFTYKWYLIFYFQQQLRKSKFYMDPLHFWPQG